MIKFEIKATLDKETKRLFLTEIVEDDFYKEYNSVRNELYELKEEMIKESLIKLGWTPPNE